MQNILCDESVLAKSSGNSKYSELGSTKLPAKTPSQQENTDCVCPSCGNLHLTMADYIEEGVSYGEVLVCNNCRWWG